MAERILLAGATGMAGRAILRALLERDAEVQVRAVRCTRPPALADPRVEWVQADLRDESAARRAAQGCDLALVAAAETAGRLGREADPARPFEENLALFTRLLGAIARSGARRLVFLGSASAYPEADRPLREEDLAGDPPEAHFGVGWAMRLAEKLAWFWHRQVGLECAILRAANIYGPHAPFEPGRSNVVAALVRKAAERADPFIVLGSAQVQRDLVYADDVAEAVLLAARAPGIAYEAFNLGSGCPTSVREIARLACEAAGHRPRKVRWQESAGNGGAPPPRVRLLDVSRIRERLGWTARTSPAEGIRKTHDWWVEQGARVPAAAGATR